MNKIYLRTFFQTGKEDSQVSTPCFKFYVGDVLQFGHFSLHVNLTWKSDLKLFSEEG